MNQRKWRLESFAPFDFQGAEEHLAAMAARGWRLERAGGFFWTYRKAEPAGLHYAVTCPPEAGREDERLFFQDLCETAGWKMVSDWAEMQIYVNPAAEPTALETDASLLLERVDRSMKGTYLGYHRGRVASAAFLLVSRLVEFWLLPRTFFLSNLSIGFAVACLLLLAFHAASYAGYWLWRRRCLRPAEEGGGLLPLPGWCKALSRMSNAELLLLLLPVFLEAGTGSLRNAVRWALAIVIFLAAVGFAVFFSRCLKRRKAGRDTWMAVLVLCVAVLLLAFGRQGISPADYFLQTQEPEAGEYLWRGQLWDEEPQAIPLTAGDLTGRNWDHVRRSVYERGRSCFGVQTDYLECVQQESGEEFQFNYEILDISNRFVYNRIRNDLLGGGKDRPYQAEDPLPWGAESAYHRSWADCPEGQRLIFWPGRIVRLYIDSSLSGEQMAEAGRRLAPREDAP